MADMHTYEVPRSDWPAFFDQFSRLHHGQPVEVQTVGSDAVTCANAQEMPLLGISAGPGREAGELARLYVSVGDERGVEIGHAILRPGRVHVSEWNDGVSAAVDVKCEDGRRTHLRVGPARELLPRQASSRMGFHVPERPTG
jgi:hypothetical protein